MAAATESVEHWVYVGQVPVGRITAGQKLSHKWFQVVGGTFPEAHFFTKNIVAACGVGSVYEVTVSRDGDTTSAFTAGTKAPKFLRMWDDEDAVREWHAEHRGALAMKAVMSERRRAESNAPTMFDMSLTELRDVIAKANWSRREGIIGAAIAYLANGER